jgi:hypothetical protein
MNQKYGCLTLSAVILSERSESKDLHFVLLRLGYGVRSSGSHR